MTLTDNNVVKKAVILELDGPIFEFQTPIQAVDKQNKTEITKVNFKILMKDKDTNVLSFSLDLNNSHDTVFMYAK